jgi:hypothetical protein
MNKTIKMIVNGQDLEFNVTVEDHNAYVNGMGMNNKVAPTRNLLMRTVAPDCKDTLKELLAENIGMDMQIGGALLEAYMPKAEILVGESSA